MKQVTVIALTILLMLAMDANAQPHFTLNEELLNLPTLNHGIQTNLPVALNGASDSFDENIDSNEKLYRFAEFSLEEEHKDPKSAIKRAIGHTTVPVVSSFAIILITNPNLFSDDGAGIFLFSSLLFFYGTTVGPSAGNLYARDFNRGVGGILVRSLSWYFILSTGSNDTMTDIGLAGLIGSALYNIATGPLSVRNYNRSVQAQLSPTVNPASGSVALTLKLKF